MLFNRDLSWLGFNYRVLQEAKEKEVPLLERLRFLSIFSSNLDEFFRVRYPIVAAFAKLNKKTIRKQSFLTQDDVAEKIQAQINDQLNEFGQVLNRELIPELLQNNVFFYYNNKILPEHKGEIKQLFLSEVLSFIQPVFLHTQNSFKFLPENGKLYFIVTLANSDNDSEGTSHFCVNIPSNKLKRFYELTPINSTEYVIFIDDVISENMGIIFPGKKIKGIYSIKFNRDADINIADEYSANLLEKIEKQLSKRDNGAASRFLFQHGMPLNVQLFLATVFKADPKDMFEGGRYHNLSDLYNFPVTNNKLFYKKLIPIQYPPITTGDIFHTVAQQDVLLHLPYQSYAPVLSFFNQAAVDADVTEIYITLYRVATESHIVNALISAAKNGKKVTAFIELKARFDEANNIKWSRVMKNAGIKLIYSDPTIKVHSKIALVKKITNNIVTNYAVISTGNFNESTAKFYTDHVLFTVNKIVCTELETLFQYLQFNKNENSKLNPTFSQLLVAQFNLLPAFQNLIDIEINKAKQGLPALIRIKVNNLEEPNFIHQLYKASKAGVKIQLLVRSICCIIPGIPNQSENITVIRIIDRFLEHSRLFIFGDNDNDATVIMGSSDLMTRNLYRRIEVCIQIIENNCKKQLLQYFALQWEDNTKAVQLDSSMQQTFVKGTELTKKLNAQTAIYNYLKDASC